MTALHPMVKFSHQLLGNPNAQDLMKIIAAVGLAQNFGAVRFGNHRDKETHENASLNILNQLATDEEEKIKFHFKDKVVFEMYDEFCKLRGIKNTSLVKINH